MLKNETVMISHGLKSMKFNENNYLRIFHGAVFIVMLKGFFLIIY